MKILAIDPAGITGYCTNSESGIWELKPKPYQSTGIKFLQLKKRLFDLLSKFKIDLIVYEKPSGGHFTGLRSHANFEGVILEFCETNSIEYKDYTASSIKLFATGNGRASKKDMIQACKEKYNIQPLDDNHADAIHLWNLANKEFSCEDIDITENNHSPQVPLSVIEKCKEPICCKGNQRKCTQI